MRFLVINLDRDADRLRYMFEELHKRGFKPERISAFLGTSIPDDLKPHFLTENGDIDSAMNKGEIGCYASHLYAMQQILAQEEDEPVCIMEDDLHFDSSFAHLPQIVTELPEDWEILRISNPAKAYYDTVKTWQGIGALVRYWRVPNTAGAYVMNKAGARKFLTYQILRKRPIDEDMRRPWEHGMESYGILPSPITNNIFDSSIDAIGGDRSLPARKRFADAGNHYGQEWRYRVRTFGLFGCLKAMLATLLFKTRYKKRSRH
ncbi:glycosyltransferase family 25 protein [Cohaesibacter intestini]|uniref:glycosyltransferase family 25 protein n=1 Tax=Cohaesibacter intestini TaxID=2211145 RepID=UPI000DEBC4B2|nr:glycosyltransferase family 25 protein [Cohaesibacter intestini]